MKGITGTHNRKSATNAGRKGHDKPAEHGRTGQIANVGKGADRAGKGIGTKTQMRPARHAPK